MTGTSRIVSFFGFLEVPCAIDERDDELWHLRIVLMCAAVALSVGCGKATPSAGVRPSSEVPRLAGGIEQGALSFPREAGGVTGGGRVPARWTGSAIRLEVPASIIDRVALPAAFDPLVSPAFPVTPDVLGPAGMSQSTPAVATGKTTHLAVWRTEERRRVWGVLLRPDGTPVDVLGFAISPLLTSETDDQPSVVFTGGSYLVVWRHAPNGTPLNGVLQGVRITESGVVSAVFQVCTASGPQGNVRLSADSQGALAVWEDERSMGRASARWAKFSTPTALS